MTISSTTRIAGPFTGNGVTTTFPFTYKVFSTADVQVIRLTISTGIETTLTIVTDYTITLNGDQDSNPGGNIVLVTPLLALYTLTATSDIANLQPTDLTNQGGFYPEVITDALDRATIQIQQISDIGDRTLKIPISDGLLNMELPPTAQRINTILGFGAAGLPTAVIPQASSITGNTVIVGTLDVTSATTLQTTLGVTGATTLSSTLGVTGAATIQGLTVGKGGGTIATNMAFGASALAANTVGVQNNAFGYLALNVNTTGNFNNAFGYLALSTNTTGISNNAFGYEALRANTTGTLNSAFGYAALTSNTTGTLNSAFGYQALANNITGLQNTAFGAGSLQSNTSGNYNTATGYTALILNSTGSYNTAFGLAAAYSNSGSGNTAVGFTALYSNSVGINNTAIGNSAGSGLTNGSNNIFIGFNAQPTSGTVSNEIKLGDAAIATFRCQVALTVVSDERDKTNIVDIPVGLNLISKIRPVSFEWNQRDGNRIGRKEFGFTAQQLQTAQSEIGIEVPYLVNNDNLENLGVSPTQLIPVLVNAIKELDKKFNDYILTHP